MWEPGRGIVVVAMMLALVLAGCASAERREPAPGPSEEANEDPGLAGLGEAMEQAGLGSLAQNVEALVNGEPAVEGVVQSASDGTLIEGAVVRLRCQENVVVTTESSSGAAGSTDGGAAGSTDGDAAGSTGGLGAPLSGTGAASGSGSTGASTGTSLDSVTFTLLGPVAFATTDASGRFAFPHIADLTQCQTPVYEAEFAGMHMVAPLVAPPLIADGETTQLVVLSLVEDST